MKKLFLLLTLFVLGISCFAEDRFQRLEKYITEVNEAYHIPGMGFIVTTPEKPIIEKAYGECTSLDQQFYIGSMSKSYTALCVMQLVEKGLVHLEDDISVYLPDYKFEKPVTVLALLNQTSGFDTHAKLHNVKITDMYGKYEYANVNYDLLGKIVEAASGHTYEDYVQQNIFGPLGMADSRANAWAVKDSPKLLLGNRNYFGFFKRGEAVFPVEKSWFHEPAGYIATTPHDHAKYLRMYLNGGKTGGAENSIISSDSIKTMWYKNVPLGEKDYDAYYGMGFNYMKYKDTPMIFHGGQVENGITYMYILPEEQLAVCFMINAGDEFVMNNLMNNVIWESIDIINGAEPAKVNHATYILLHILYDFIYLLMIGFSVLILIKAIKSKPGFAIKKLICGVTGYILWPVLLLTFSELFFDTPLWVVKLYVTDLFIIIVTIAIISFSAGVIRCVKLFRCC